MLITTKFIGPTNYKDSRIKATCDLGSLTIGYNDTLNSAQNHYAAAAALAEKHEFYLVDWDWNKAGYAFTSCPIRARWLYPTERLLQLQNETLVRQGKRQAA